MFVRSACLSVATFLLLPLQYPLLNLFLFGFHLSRDPGDPCKRDHLIPFRLCLEMSRAFGRRTRSHQVQDLWSRFPGEDESWELLACVTLWWWELELELVMGIDRVVVMGMNCRRRSLFLVVLIARASSLLWSSNQRRAEEHLTTSSFLWSLKKEDRRTFDKILFNLMLKPKGGGKACCQHPLYFEVEI